MWKTLMMMICAVLFVSGCDRPQTVREEPAFKDVARHPPKVKPATFEAIVADRPLAEWIEAHGIACDTYGCLP